MLVQIVNLETTAPVYLPAHRVIAYVYTVSKKCIATFCPGIGCLSFPSGGGTFVFASERVIA